MMLSRGRRLLMFTVLLAAADPGSAAKLTDKEHTRIEEPRPADLPSDGELEAAGAVIGNIDIDIRNIFDESDEREKNGLYRLANHLHIRTKRSTIKAVLLFASGDKYAARKLAETERALRLLVYIYDARVVPVRYADGKVDIKVITKDVWTLSPGISFGRAGGSNSNSFNLQDTNFLGWGKALQVSHEAMSTAPATPSPGRTRTCSAPGGARLSATSIPATGPNARCRSCIPFIRWMRRGARRSRR